MNDFNINIIYSNYKIKDGSKVEVGFYNLSCILRD